MKHFREGHKLTTPIGSEEIISSIMNNTTRLAFHKEIGNSAMKFS